MGIELPRGFGDASKDVQLELLSSYQSEDLADEIATELGLDLPRSGQLNKQHKAAILIALRE